MKLWVWDVTVLCLVRVEGSGCFFTGVGSLRDVFLYTLYIISTILSFEHICTSIFFLLSNVLTKLKYGPLYWKGDKNTKCLSNRGWPLENQGILILTKNSLQCGSQGNRCRIKYELCFFFPITKITMHMDHIICLYVFR